MYKFELVDSEIKKFEKWKKKQKKKDPFMPTAGERWTFMFTPTGIGSGLVVYSHKTKTELDLTDVDSW